IWLADFEYSQSPGERPQVVCLVAREYRSGRTLRVWEDELRYRREAPFPTSSESLFVAFHAPAELSCFLELVWPFPAHMLDRCAEFKRITSGLYVHNGRGLLGMLTWFGLDAMSVSEKKEMQALACRGGPWTSAERTALLDYCEVDVVALTKALPLMLPQI